MIENIIKNISSYFTLTKFLTLEEQKIIEQKCRYYVFYPLESERVTTLAPSCVAFSVA